MTTAPPGPEDDGAPSSDGDDAPEVTVRQAVQADLLAVYRIEKQSFPQPWPFEAFERFLGDPGFLVAWEDGKVVGYVVADQIPNHGRPFGHVKDLAVHPERRGQGVGSTLLSRALSVLAAGGVGSVKLEVRVPNEGARDLYRRFGFEPVKRMPGYYDDGDDAFVMVRDL